MIKPRGISSPSDLQQKHRGALSELLAQAWLLQEGYDVFKNVAPHGLADLIGWKPGQAPELFDVKTLGFYRNSKVRTGWSPTINRLSLRQLGLRVRPVYVHPETGCVGFDATLVANSGTPRPAPQSARAPVPSGEAHGQTTLRKTDVLAIRRIMDGGLMTRADVAQRYNVSPSTVGNIASRRTWKHLREPA